MKYVIEHYAHKYVRTLKRSLQNSWYFFVSS